MIETSARLLALLGLLQSRSSWSGPELAGRLDVQQRTLRNDIRRLRALGYPIDSVRGPAGGYRLGNHGKMPPLLLEDNEAVAVAVGLSAVSDSPGVAESSAVALAKLEQVLPDRLRRRVRALADSTDLGPSDTETNMDEPVVDTRVLADLAAAVRDHEGLRFFYGDDEERFEADPYRLVSWQRRWYVVARVRPSQEWRSFRVEWMALRTPGASRFTPNPLGGGDYSAFVLREVASTGWKVHARVLVDAPAAEVLSRIHAAVGVVETIDSEHCVLVTGADTLETVAVWIGMLGLDFHVSEPPELVEHLRVLGRRYLAALPDPA
ncbi:helix-turn-helix transcriptional regulator [Luteipulveratus mongoliensis]|uniref:DeoR faimly transcriptional regulator n=1 Tax=Luteipulveratus mongoliensis TaxID=571913 RepID=A0A0K1JDZ8_9MICO|nr:WYL domain-containing protein [Luteipulveratus mongoliensis]AKU14810.1 DeoR faimly transcriptional regulator [Luteipulveratus mongoliensis]